MKKLVFVLILIILLTLPASALQFFYDKPIYSYPGGQRIGFFSSGTLIDNYQIVKTQGNWICIDFRDGFYSIKGWINKENDDNKKIDISEMFKVNSIKYVDKEIAEEKYIEVIAEIENKSFKDFPSGVILKITLYDFFDNIIASEDIIITNWRADTTKTFSQSFDLLIENKNADDVRDYKIQFEAGV
ncbi:MAG: hypothetical protein ACQESP_13445 [Candidatus Muiribacteriota bacterium]